MTEGFVLCWWDACGMWSLRPAQRVAVYGVRLPAFTPKAALDAVPPSLPSPGRTSQLTRRTKSSVLKALRIEALALWF